MFLSSKRPANQVGDLISLFANDTGSPSVLLVSYQLSGHRGSHRRPFDECSKSLKVATFRLMLTGLAFLVLIKLWLRKTFGYADCRPENCSSDRHHGSSSCLSSLSHQHWLSGQSTLVRQLWSSCQIINECLQQGSARTFVAMARTKMEQAGK